MPRVPAEGKFVGIFSQMLAGDVMPGANHSALEQGEERFGSVRRSPRTVWVLALIFAPRVIHSLMCFPVFQRVLVAGVLVGIDDGVFAHAFRQGRPEILLGDRSDYFH